MRVAPLALAAVLLGLLLTGCVHEKPPRGSTATPAGDSCAQYSAPEFLSGSAFQGANAFGHVLRLTCDFSTSPAHETYRIPGTTGRDAAALYIAGTLQGHGWAVRWENFTGAEYQALPHGGVSEYTQPGYCGPENETRVAGLTFANVVAEVGSGGPLYVLMAHYDSKRFASSDPDPANRTKPVLGANDGASGVGVLLEAARLLPRAPAGATLRILLDDGEDGFEDCHPLAGAIFHAHHLTASERSRFAGLFLLDMVGDADARFSLTSNNATLRAQIVDTARELGVSSIANAINRGVSDDHVPFMEMGLPAADLIDFQPGATFTPYWHTTSDTPQQLSPEMLRDVGRVVVELGSNWTAG